MSNKRYPKDLAITLQDFEVSGWKEAVDQALSENYPMLSQSLSEAAHIAIELGQLKTGKILWLLADACSMVLSPSKDREDPFKPYIDFATRRTVTTDSFLDADITFFTEIADAIDHILLKARIADLLWLRCSPPDRIKFALKAIDAYSSLPLNADSWGANEQDCWQRAITLTLKLGKGARDKLDALETTIIQKFNTATFNDGYFKLRLADFLTVNKLRRGYHSNIASQLETLGREFEQNVQLNLARDCFSAAAELYYKLSDGVKEAEMFVAQAECWVKDATLRSSSESPNHIETLMLYESAIHAYRSIPGAQRSIHNVEERVAELRTYLSNAGEHSLNEMKSLKTGEINISQLIENSINAVTGKDAHSAMFSFANVYRGINKDALQSDAIQRMGQFPMLALLSQSMLGSDGRIIAKRPSFTYGEEPEKDKIVIRSEMIREYGTIMEVVVRGKIWPALEVLQHEHRFRESDFIAMAKNSYMIPKERASLFAKALFAGYERDFITALHLLIPQIEHIVRVHLKQAGAQTANIDTEGIVNENGMSTLMALKMADQVFGENLAFELRSLFCDAFGPNLRNELAHGLLEENECDSYISIYAWWFALRLTLNPWMYSTGGTTRQNENSEVNNEQTPTTESSTEQS